jgi:hypothetical protein
VSWARQNRFECRKVVGFIKDYDVVDRSLPSPGSLPFTFKGIQKEFALYQSVQMQGKILMVARGSIRLILKNLSIFRVEREIDQFVALCIYANGLPFNLV